MSWQAEYNKASEGLKYLRQEHGNSVYEVKRIDLANGAFVTERMVTIEGYSERVVWASKWEQKKRYECFCCTCPDYGGSDAACRNHGYYGKRPCDIHNLPGSKWEDSDEMPDPVSVAREKNR